MQTATPRSAPPGAPDVRVWDLFAFLAELLMLAGLALAGWEWGSTWTASLLLGVTLPATVVVVWSRWCAPRSTHRLARLPRLALKTLLFAGTLLLLLSVGRQPTAGMLALTMWLAFLLGVPGDRSRRERIR